MNLILLFIAFALIFLNGFLSPMDFLLKKAVRKEEIIKDNAEYERLFY